MEIGWDGARGVNNGQARSLKLQAAAAAAAAGAGCTSIKLQLDLAAATLTVSQRRPGGAAGWETLGQVLRPALVCTAKVPGARRAQSHCRFAPPRIHCKTS